jgi:hypothetical protein
VLEDFTLATFADRLGETFRVGDDPDVLEMELVEATAGIAGRQFSIVFRGPPEPVLPQRIYPFGHEELGSFELFIVPIGPDDSGMQYQAVFG